MKVKKRIVKTTAFLLQYETKEDLQSWSYLLSDFTSPLPSDSQSFYFSRSH